MPTVSENDAQRSFVTAHTCQHHGEQNPFKANAKDVAVHPVWMGRHAQSVHASLLPERPPAHYREHHNHVN
jgi:hypothetical protein